MVAKRDACHLCMHENMTTLTSTVVLLYIQEQYERRQRNDVFYCSCGYNSRTSAAVGSTPTKFSENTQATVAYLVGPPRRVFGPSPTENQVQTRAACKVQNTVNSRPVLPVATFRSKYNHSNSGSRQEPRAKAALPRTTPTDVQPHDAGSSANNADFASASRRS